MMDGIVSPPMPPTLPPRWLPVTLLDFPLERVEYISPTPWMSGLADGVWVEVSSQGPGRHLCLLLPSCIPVIHREKTFPG